MLGWIKRRWQQCRTAMELSARLDLLTEEMIEMKRRQDELQRIADRKAVDLARARDDLAQIQRVLDEPG